jgi:4-amino-4-deoxy-L-arabinose transferase-like glycosyltransferase
MNTLTASELQISDTDKPVGVSSEGRVSAFKVTGLLAVAIIMGSIFVDWHALFVNGLHTTLNDQVSYVSVGRNWADQGTLDSKLIYPATLTQDFTRNSYYMPGYYWVLGITYKLLGYSVVHSLLPSLFALALSTALVFVIGSRLYGPVVAYLSCALFVFFPMNLIYAFTAMAEMTVVAAALVAFAVFLHLPPRWKPVAGPLLVALPMAFRETSAALAVVMALMIFEQSRWQWKPVALFGALTMVVVMLVIASPLSAGRPGLLHANVFGGENAVYFDAFALQDFHPHVGDWALAIGSKFRTNLLTLVRPRNWSPEGLLDYGTRWFLLAGIPLGVGWWLWRRKRDGFFLGVAGMVLVSLLFLLGFYTVKSFRGARHLLVTEPFVALLIASQLHQLSKGLLASPRAKEVVVVVVAVIGVSWAYCVFRTEPAINQQAARDTAFLESLGLDDRRLVVSPHWLSLDYVEKHYPVQWAFVPTNGRTLRLLNERYPIGAVVLPVGGAAWARDDVQLQARDVAQIGLTDQTEVAYRGITFAVFKRGVGRSMER